jgi:hypothetical protein
MHLNSSQVQDLHVTGGFLNGQHGHYTISAIWFLGVNSMEQPAIHNHQTSRAGVLRRNFRPTAEAAPLLDRIEFALWKYLSALAAI